MPTTLAPNLLPQKEFGKVARLTGVGFLAVGLIGFLVKARGTATACPAALHRLTAAGLCVGVAAEGRQQLAALLPGRLQRDTLECGLYARRGNAASAMFRQCCARWPLTPSPFLLPPFCR